MLAIAILASYGWFLLAVYIIICLFFFWGIRNNSGYTASFWTYVAHVSRIGLYISTAASICIFLLLMLMDYMGIMLYNNIEIVDGDFYIFLVSISFIFGYIASFLLFSLTFLVNKFLLMGRLIFITIYMIVTSVLLFFLLPIGAIAMTFGFSF